VLNSHIGDKRTSAAHGTNHHLLGGIPIKLQAEVRMAVPKGKGMVAEDDLNGLTYLKAIVKETLRLHAPACFLCPTSPWLIAR
jgi:cytochrome P450